MEGVKVWLVMLVRAEKRVSIDVKGVKVVVGAGVSVGVTVGVSVGTMRVLVIVSEGVMEGNTVLVEVRVGCMNRVDVACTVGVGVSGASISLIFGPRISPTKKHKTTKNREAMMSIPLAEGALLRACASYCF